MKLIDYYNNDLACTSGKQRKERKLHWHHAARRYLNMLSLTADPIPKLHVDSEGVTTVPIASFFLRWSVEELFALYRLTKPRRSVKRVDA